MEDQENRSQGQPAPPPPPPPLPAPESEPPAADEDEEEEDDSKKEEEELVAKVNRLMEKITSAPDNPKAAVLHALASILETQESRCVLFRFLSFLISPQWLEFAVFFAVFFFLGFIFESILVFASDHCC